MAGSEWRKSTRCGPDNGCVALLGSARYVLVRDDKDPDGSQVLVFGRAPFAGFVAAAKAGRFDRSEVVA